MHRIELPQPTSALELKEQLVDASRTAASLLELFAVFKDNRQPKHQYDRAVRAGNSKHRDWSIFLQPYPSIKPSSMHLGEMMVRGPVDTTHMQFGGFDYGQTGLSEPVYSEVFLWRPKELGFRYHRELPQKIWDITTSTMDAALNGIPG